MAKSKNINLNLTPEDKIQETLFDDWRKSIDGYNGENTVNPSNFEIVDKEIGDIKEALKHISNLHFEIVEELPAVGEPNIIYLILSEESKEKNFYDEYIYLEDSEKFELIGSTQITFDNTPTKDSPNAITSGGVYNALLDKQNIIQDLDTIRSGSQKGETAVQPNDLATVATTGSYNDLKDKPEIPLEQVQSDWNQTDIEAKDYIKNKPTIPDAQVNSDWNAESGISSILNKPDLSIYAEEEDLSDVAFSGSYKDLTDTPTIPLAQVQSDWNQEDDTQPDYIKHKPDIPSGQVQSNWAEEDSDKVSYIQNKPDFEDMIAEEQSRAIAVETELETKIEEKQDELTAGQNIIIENNVISATVDEFDITSQELSQIIAEEEDNTFDTYVEEYDDGYIVNLGNVDVNDIIGEFDEETSPATYNQFTNNVDL